jgi:hypothetical protein
MPSALATPYTPPAASACHTPAAGPLRVQQPALTGEQAAALAAALADVDGRVVRGLPSGARRDSLSTALRDLRFALPRAARHELLGRARRARVALDALGRGPPAASPDDVALVRLLLDRVDAESAHAPSAPGSADGKTVPLRPSLP